jgi:hypothetical protein
MCSLGTSTRKFAGSYTSLHERVLGDGNPAMYTLLGVRVPKMPSVPLTCIVRNEVEESGPVGAEGTVQAHDLQPSQEMQG